MKNEIATAVVFMTSMVKNKSKLTKEQLNTFSDKLTVALAVKYRNHWYEESPSRGQAYRCLRISPNVPQEPMLRRVAKNSNIEYSELCLPKDMVLWVDPGEVACRFGDRGSTFLVSSFKRSVAPEETKNLDDKNNQTQVTNSGENVYRYTKYTKQPIYPSRQYHTQEKNNAKNRYQAQDFDQDQYQSQDRYQDFDQDQYQSQDRYQAQDQYWSPYWDQDQYQPQDRYHWNSIYNSQTVTVA